MNYLAAALLLSLFSPSLFAQQAKPDDSMKDCPMHAQHTAQTHHEAVESHGDQAMGFPHDKTTHHFRMMSDGGSIEVTVNDPNDRANAAAIREHLTHIAMSFGRGDFAVPMFVHDGTPPGVTTMKLMKAAIRYTYNETPSGGQIRITSEDPIGVAATHDFLRFQIVEHQTGDALEVSK